MDQLSLSQSQTSLLYMKDDWVWQMALHEKQWTENHLKQFYIHKHQKWDAQTNWCTDRQNHHRLLTTLCCTWELGSIVKSVHQTYSKAPLEQGTWQKYPAVIHSIITYITFIHTCESVHLLCELLHGLVRKGLLAPCKNKDIWFPIACN